ncbi:MAG TPA: ATP-binding protein [Candidatus Dormibacteraeota bacterium]
MRTGRAGAVLRRSLRPPIGDWRFWLIQTCVIVIAAAFWAAVASGRWQLSVFWGGELLALFLLPVVYAALNFGLAGALATAVWVSILSLPAVPLAASAERAWSMVIEVVLFLAVALFVGDRVEREIIQRREAEAARGAMRLSEARLRSLFENSPAATLLVDPDGAIREANPAAAVVFGRGRGELVGVPLADLAGAGPARAIGGGAPLVIELGGQDGGRRFLRPVVSRGRGAGAFQVVFLDVSEERRRLGLKDAYAAYVIKAQEEERARIAQELHDEPLQDVVRLYRLLDRLSAAPAGPPEDVRRGLGEARGVAEGIAEELRRLARGLRPASLEDLGLVTVLGRLVADVDGRDSLRAELRVEGEPRRLDPLLELGLFRIAQEGVRNVERHARARNVSVGLRFEADAVELTVEDDGRGLPAAVLADGEPQGLGLVGMDERAALLGGRFEIRSTPQRGTHLRARIPAR